MPRWPTREPEVDGHPQYMELLGFVALFAGLAFLAALPLMALLALAERPRRDRCDH